MGFSGDRRGGAGSDLLVEAVLTTAFVLAENTLLHPLVAWVGRRPVHASHTESRIGVRTTTDAADLPAMRRTLFEPLQAARYPAADTEAVERGVGGQFAGVTAWGRRLPAREFHMCADVRCGRVGDGLRPSPNLSPPKA